MHADTVVALVSSVVAAIIAIVVPWMTFRFALRQGREQWIRKQRSQLHMDMLTEAQAEKARKRVAAEARPNSIMYVGACPRPKAYQLGMLVKSR